MYSGGEPWEESRYDPSLRLEGDFYYEPDDVQRGIPQVHAAPDLMMGWAQGCDFYGVDAEAAMRGATLFDDQPHKGGKMGCFGPEEASWLPPPPLVPGSALLAREAVSDECFTDQFSPALVPFGGLAPTSMDLIGVASAAKVANSIYAFLTQELSTTTNILKKRLPKFAINAHIMGDSRGVIRGSCIVKARVFCQPSSPDMEGGLMLEFRRMDGDPVVFADVFKQAERYLRSHLLNAVDPPEATEMTGVEAVGQAMAVEGSPLGDPSAVLNPLIDMLSAASACQRKEAAEAVTALAALAGASAASAAAICSALAGMQGALAILVASGQLDIAYPAARLAAQMASHGMNGMAEPLLQAVLAGVASLGTNRLVRLELAEALKNTAYRGEPMHLLERQINEVLQNPELCNEELVADRLLEAQRVLEKASFSNGFGIYA